MCTILMLLQIYSLQYQTNRFNFTKIDVRKVKAKICNIIHVTISILKTNQLYTLVKLIGYTLFRFYAMKAT